MPSDLGQQQRRKGQIGIGAGIGEAHLDAPGLGIGDVGNANGGRTVDYNCAHSVRRLFCILPGYAVLYQTGYKQTGSGTRRDDKLTAVVVSGRQSGVAGGTDTLRVRVVE